MRNQREYYRVSYPSVLMPRILIDDVEFRVLELSERGLRFECPRNREFDLDEPVAGYICFDDGEVIAMSGEINRREDSVYVIVNVEGISFGRIINEQRKMLLQFPSVRSS